MNGLIQVGGRGYSPTEAAIALVQSHLRAEVSISHRMAGFHTDYRDAFLDAIPLDQLTALVGDLTTLALAIRNAQRDRAHRAAGQEQP